MSNLYVLEFRVDYEGSTVMGVFSSKKKLMESVPNAVVEIGSFHSDCSLWCVEIPKNKVRRYDVMNRLDQEEKVYPSKVNQ